MIQSLNESGIDKWTLQNALLCLLTLKLSTPHLSRGMLFCTRASLMFETHTPPWFHQHLEALSLLILTRLIGNPYSKCKCKLVLGTTKGTFLSFHIKLNRFQGRNRSGVVKGEPWSPPFIVPHSLPNHHSQYPTGASLTLNICPTLPL